MLRNQHILKSFLGGGENLMKIKTLNKTKINDLIFVGSILVPIIVLFIIIRFIPIFETIITSFEKKV